MAIQAVDGIPAATDDPDLAEHPRRPDEPEVGRGAPIAHSRPAERDPPGVVVQFDDPPPVGALHPADGERVTTATRVGEDYQLAVALLGIEFVLQELG